jgi:hypothetical protein
MTTQKNVCSYASVTGKKAKGLDFLIQDAIGSAKTMRIKVQCAAVAILIHLEKSGDYRKANDLVTGLGHGVNSTALVDWFVTYGGLTIDEAGTAFDGWSGSEYIKERFQGAKAKAWYSFKKVNPYKGFDLMAQLEALVKKASNAQEKLDETSKIQDEAEKVAAKKELENVISIPQDKLTALLALVA